MNTLITNNIHIHDLAVSKLCRICSKLISEKANKVYKCNNYKDGIESVFGLKYNGSTDPHNMCVKCYTNMKSSSVRGDGKSKCFVKRLWSDHIPLHCDTCNLLTKQVSGGRPSKLQKCNNTVTFVPPNDDIMFYSYNTEIAPLSNVYDFCCGVCTYSLTPCSVQLECGHLVCLKCLPIYTQGNIVKCTKCATECSADAVSSMSSYLISIVLSMLCICNICSKTDFFHSFHNHTCDLNKDSFAHQTCLPESHDVCTNTCLPESSEASTNTDLLPDLLNDSISSILNVPQKSVIVHKTLARWLPALEDDNGMAKIKGYSGRVSKLQITNDLTIHFFTCKSRLLIMV